jgi:hypothetical protein
MSLKRHFLKSIVALPVWGHCGTPVLAPAWGCSCTLVWGHCGTPAWAPAWGCSCTLAWEPAWAPVQGNNYDILKKHFENVTFMSVVVLKCIVNHRGLQLKTFFFIVS